ncbi:Hypothetical protein CINCED_3A024870 [Cinara cedri]|uniref:Uncharacterized protein n=1 Tax=Cinara cedri TaxID=506608 RepID=A0A5E4MPL7_9HEMI|nr:Hypothetical protein CINCED_3A024870 [Cinara cedri]
MPRTLLASSGRSARMFEAKKNTLHSLIFILKFNPTLYDFIDLVRETNDELNLKYYIKRRIEDDNVRANLKRKSRDNRSDVKPSKGWTDVLEDGLKNLEFRCGIPDRRERQQTYFFMEAKELLDRGEEGQFSDLASPRNARSPKHG